MNIDQFFGGMVSREWLLAYDGEVEGESGGEGEGEGGEGEGGGEGTVTKTETKIEKKEQVKGKTFTQEDVNKMLAEDRRKSQKNRDQLVNELKSIRENKNLTEKERDDLSARIEQLQTETLTAQEVAKRDKDKITRDFTKQLDTERADKNKIWSMYSKEKITRELQDAAVEQDAISPTQIINFLEPSTKLVEELRDGQPTGAWVSRVVFRDKDDKGATITLELSVTDAVKRMKEIPEHWNLFKSGVNGGLGSFNSAQTNVVKGGRPPSDPALYRKWRESVIPGGKR